MEVLQTLLSLPEYWKPVELTYATTMVSLQPHVQDLLEVTFCLVPTPTRTSEN